MSKYNSWIAVIIAIVAVVIAAVGGNNQSQDGSLGSSGTRYPNGISADTTSPSVGEVRGTTMTITSTGSLGGKVTLNAGQLRSYTNATSTTATSQTLKEADILNYDTVLITPNTGALTLTLPATSTLTTMIPTAGDMQETCFYNATGTAAAVITFAAGAGIDWENVASSTAVVQVPPTLSANEYGCFKFIRETDTDVGALYTPYVNAD